MLARRASVSSEEARRVGDLVSEHIADTEPGRVARRIGLYAAAGGEPDLRGLFEHGCATGKVMLLPRCGPDHRLEFCVVEAWGDLVPGRYGVLEPPSECAPADLRDLDLLVVPAVAVDGHGARLGRGGGWYDRTFPGRAGDPPRMVAAVHAFQVVDRVPSGALDRPVDGWASERAVRWIRRG